MENIFTILIGSFGKNFNKNIQIFFNTQYIIYNNIHMQYMHIYINLNITEGVVIITINRSLTIHF